MELTIAWQKRVLRQSSFNDTVLNPSERPRSERRTIHPIEQQTETEQPILISRQHPKRRCRRTVTRDGWLIIKRKEEKKKKTFVRLIRRAQ